MLPNAKYYDVWILKANQVIREVPIDTVLGWTNERRLVAKDKIRPAGTSDWFEVGEINSFSTPTNQISSNETVVFDGPPSSPISKYQEADDEIDMIPLIDVSLVLLVYFLMSTSSLGSGTSTKLPVAEFASVQEIKGQVWIEIENKNNLLNFKTGFADKKKAPPSEFNTQESLISYLELEIRKGQGSREVTIYAPGEITAGIIRNLTTLIEKTLGEKEISKIHLGVTGKK